MAKKQAGFTLIELVVVLVLLGIVGAVATARFQDLSGEARIAARDGIAAEIQSGSAINYAEGVLQNPVAFQQPVTNATTCTAIANGLLQGNLPNGWQMRAIAPNPTACGTAGNTDTTCVLENSADTGVSTPIAVICTG